MLDRMFPTIYHRNKAGAKGLSHPTPLGIGMDGQDTQDIVADLINVYTSAAASASEAAQRSRDLHLPLLERLAYRHQALKFQELADQARRMINELTTGVAA